MAIRDEIFVNGHESTKSRLAYRDLCLQFTSFRKSLGGEKEYIVYRMEVR